MPTNLKVIAFSLAVLLSLGSEPLCMGQKTGSLQPTGKLIPLKTTGATRPVAPYDNKQLPGQGIKRIPVAERGLKPLNKPFTVTGEVVDSWCYASQVMGAGRGEAHKPCALACGHGGVTLGIVDDQGTLFIAAKSKAYTGCKELLVPFIAKRVKATGWLATKGGSNIMKIQTVELAK